jgi:hypothetical protein
MAACTACFSGSPQIGQSGNGFEIAGGPELIANASDIGSPPVSSVKKG